MSQLPLSCLAARMLALLLSAMMALGAMPVSAKTASYALDPVHTRIAFQVSHAGFSNPIGSFSGSTGHLEFDDKDWSTARLDVRVPLASLNLGDSKWQQKILDSTFFNASKFPEARFVSTQVKMSDAQHGSVVGDLTLHGVTHPVTLSVTLNALKRHPLTLKKTAGFSATATLSRKDFGISAWEHLVGDQVQLILEVEAVRVHEASPATGGQADADAQ